MLAFISKIAGRFCGCHQPKSEESYPIKYVDNETDYRAKYELALEQEVEFLRERISVLTAAPVAPSIVARVPVSVTSDKETPSPSPTYTPFASIRHTIEQKLREKAADARERLKENA